MTTNKEWLFSLPLEEQIAWMESEHSEPNPDCSAMLYRMYTENMKHEPCSHYEPKDDVSGYGADFNVVEPNFDNIKAVEMDASRFEAVEMDASRLVVREPDSREKLEADVRKHYAYSTTTLMYPPSANKTTDMLGALPVDTVIGWLDRQAAITQHEITERWAEHLHPIERECGDLRRKVDELTAERDTLQGALDIAVQNESKLEDECDELQKQVDELTNAGRKMSTELANMQDYITKVRAGRERYRSMCSEMATKIHDALMVMDEGMA